MQNPVKFGIWIFRGLHVRKLDSLYVHNPMVRRTLQNTFSRIKCRKEQRSARCSFDLFGINGRTRFAPGLGISRIRA